MFLQISLMSVLTEESWTLTCAPLARLSRCITLLEVYEENLISYSRDSWKEKILWAL